MSGKGRLVRNLPALIGLASVAAAGSLLVGCGGGGTSSGGQTTDSEASKSPSQILKDAKRAVRSVRSVHLAGRGLAQRQPANLDLSLARGPEATGRMRLLGGSVDLIRIRESFYMRGDRSFWRHFGRNPLKLALLTDRWVEAPSSIGAFKGIASLTDISSLTTLLGEHGKISNEGTRTFRGRRVIALHDATEGGTLYLRATGTPLPVALVGGKQSDSETIIFDRWNQQVVVRAPKHALSMDAGL